MAKKYKKKAQNKWLPQPNDAINLATIHWFAIMMEAKAIEIYGTNPAVYPKIEQVLGACLSSVAGINAKKPIADPGDCPPGWVPCGDDCAPKCMSDDNDS